jgi:hypothetical protein
MLKLFLVWLIILPIPILLLVELGNGSPHFQPHPVQHRIAPVIADLPVVELGYFFIQHPRELRLLLG